MLNGFKNLTLLFLVAACLVLTLADVYLSAETWHLSSEDKWQGVSDDPDGQYMLAVAKIKQLIAAGDAKGASRSLVQLKKDFAEITGPDLDAFIDAELLYARGAWIKSVRKYDKFLETWPSSWLYESALEREYSIAVAFLDGQKRKIAKVFKFTAYEEGANIMYDIADAVGTAPIAERSLITLAKSYEKRGKYFDAYDTWADISSRWPTGDVGRDSLLGMAQSLHSAYNGPRFDSSGLVSAQSYYGSFKERYPQSAAEYDIDGKMTMVDEQLAYKYFEIGRYYERTDNKQAANMYYQKVLDDWPGSSAAKMALTKTQSDDPSGKKSGGKGRVLFEIGNSFLDSWFGLRKLLKSD